MRRLLYICILVLSAMSMMAENYASNARAEQVERTMVITYDLSKTANVRLLVSTNMSNDFKEVKKVTGAVGKNVQAGSNRQITWNVLEEYDRFVADGVRFKVEAISPIPLRVSESQITTTAAGVTKYITVTCDKPWEIQYPFATMYSATRSGSSVKVVVSPNTSTSARDDYFYIRTTDESEKVKISLSQFGKLSTTSSLSSSLSSSSPSSSPSSLHSARNNMRAEHEYIDLGLSVKWATSNMNGHYRFGEKNPRPTRGNNADRYEGATYSLSNDVARANWGDKWRLPTKSEFEELINKCTWTQTTQGGEKGFKVTGPNGNSIFLPAAGTRHESGNNLTRRGEVGYYWSSTHYGGGRVWILNIYCDGLGGSQKMVGAYGSFGNCIRPVLP